MCIGGIKCIATNACLFFNQLVLFNQVDAIVILPFIFHEVLDLCRSDC